jgi:PAS domain S-box-containing protein
MASPAIAPALLEHLADGVLACDADGVTLTLNREARAIFGAPHQHVSAAEWSEHFGVYLPGEDRLAAVEELPLSRALRGEQVRDVVLEVRRPGHPARLVSVSGGPVTTQRGRLLGAVVAVRDITVQASMERAALALGALANEIPAAVILVREAGGEIAYVNDCANEMFGYQGGELVGQPFAVLDAPIVDPVERANEVVEALRDHGIWNGEIEHVHKSGRLLWCAVSISPFRHPEYGPVWISVHNDIGPRRAAADAALEAAERFRSVFEQSPVGIMLTSDDGRLLDVNPRVCVITGYGREELVGRTISDLAHPHDVSRIKEAWHRTLTIGTPVDRMEFRWITKHGDVIRVECRGSAVRNSLGRPVSGLAVVAAAT